MRLKKPLGSLARPRVAARRLGVRMLAASPEEVQLDLDTEDALATFRTMLPRVQAWIALTVLTDTPSRSGVGRHVRLRLPRALSPVERIALQLVLGSDPAREWLNLVKVWGGGEDPIQLFEKESE